MATRDAIEIVVSCPNLMHHGDEICDCTKPEFELAVIAKTIVSLPSTPSSGSTSSKRSIWSDDEESSSDSERDQKRAKTRSLSPFLPRRSFREIDAFLSPPGNLFVDKTECIIALPKKFRYLILRPPQFGKSMFLSALYHFYDIHGAKHFDKRFGSLAVVTKASTPVPHSQHLSLSFNLSNIMVGAYHTDIVYELTHQISFVLAFFLIKYAKELELSDADDYLDDEKDLPSKFAKMFDLVKSRGYTLFVGVDNYDSPTRTLTLGVDHPMTDGRRLSTAREIEELLNSCFWQPLMAATDVIDKLCVTGTLLVNYPSLESLDSAVPNLHNACGFTSQEALYFTESLLDQTPNIDDLRRSCGEYTFPPQNETAGSSLLHPRLLINQIFELSSPHPPVDEDSFELLSELLQTLPEESDVPGAVTLNDLVHLLASGAVDIGGGGEKASPFDLAATKAVTWSTLHSAGALTYDRQSGDTLRVASSQALSLIHSRVDDFFCDRHELGVTFTTAWYYFGIAGDPEPLLELLLEVLHDLARRSFDKKHEPNLHGIFELIMRNSRCRARRNVDPIIIPLTESPCVQVPAYQDETDVTFELHTLTLRGMWQAANPNDDEPTVEALEALHEELIALEEDELLARPYATWSPTLNAMEMVLVGSFFDCESPEIPRFLAVGGAHVLLRQRLPEDSEEEED